MGRRKGSGRFKSRSLVRCELLLASPGGPADVQQRVETQADDADGSAQKSAGNFPSSLGPLVRSLGDFSEICSLIKL